MNIITHSRASVQFSSVAQSCPTLCDPMNRSTPGLPVHHHLLEFTQTHVHRVRYAIQPSHPRSSPSPTAANHRIRNSLTLMRFVYPQWHTHLHMQANSDTMKNIPRYSFAHNKAHSEAHKFSDINTLTFTDTHICAFPQIQPYINKITQKTNVKH